MNKIKELYNKFVYGYTDEEIYNLDETLAKSISKLTFALSEVNHGTPDGLNEIQWDNILKQISFGFASYIEMRSGAYSFKDAEYKRLKKEYNSAMMLFLKYHPHLWD